jgi:poly(A) polymerase
MASSGDLPELYRKPLEKLNQLARGRGQEVWLCGGYVRDLLLGITPGDLDLCASGDALGLARTWAVKAGGRYIPLDEEHATARIAFGGFYLDISGLRASSLEGDLARRDFTVNALVIGLAGMLRGNPEVIDPLNGAADLKKGVLRAASQHSLRDDPLRVLRAFRFMSSHGFAFSGSLSRLIKQEAGHLPGMAKERIAAEWLALAGGRQAALAIQALDRHGILTRLWPGLEMGRGMEQNPFHHLGVLEHALACVEALGQILEQPRRRLGQLAKSAEEFREPGQARAMLFTAALLHDLAKPATAREKEPGWTSFHRHDVEGGSMAGQACRRLGLSNSQSSRVAKLVASHMRPFQLSGAQAKGKLSRRAIRRLVVQAGEDLNALFILALADTMAGKGPKRPPEAEQRLLALFQKVREALARDLAAALAAPPLLNGNEVMRALDLEAGPEVGRILLAAHGLLHIGQGLVLQILGLGEQSWRARPLPGPQSPGP